MDIQLFIPCLIDSLFPETGEAVVEVLTHAGCKVHFQHGQTCCGQPAYNAGYWADARGMALHTLEVFAGSSDPIVIPSGSCTHMIRHGYPELFRDDPTVFPQARALAQRTFELSEFLLAHYSWTPMTGRDARRYAYHPSCHLLRGIGVTQEPLRLLETSGYENVVRLSPECCGFGGIFAVDHAVISNEMLQRRLDEIASAGVEAIVGCDVSCLMNIEGALRRGGSKIRCAHLAALLTGREAGLR
ncbi:MAG: (Fe-S)-binding protein [Anaerolineales bacterium]|nr:(Fe-S)-binding protein [Anaerolineales bacterium]